MASSLRKVLIVSAVVLGVLFIVFIVFLAINFSARTLVAYAASATLSRFDLVSGPTGGGGGGGGQLLQYNLTVDVRVRNRNRRVNYKYTEAGAGASYGGKQFAFEPMQPFYLHHRTEHTVTTTFNGSSAIGDDDRVDRTYQREKGEGFYFITLKLYATLRFKSGPYKSEITCRLRLPVPNSNSPAVTKLETKCGADFTDIPAYL